MSQEIERKTVTCEYSLWKPELREFVLEVFDRFYQEFGPTSSYYYNEFTWELNAKLEPALVHINFPADVQMGNGLTFEFRNHIEPVYFNESDELIDLHQGGVEPPLYNEVFFCVKISRLWFGKDKRLFNRVVDFFNGLVNEGEPIQEIFPDERIEGKYYYGAVHAFIDPGGFEREIQEIPVDIQPPKRWYVDRKEFLEK